ncbi:hypothetical protein CBS101457_001644 [Exobasidium rhododendri]|nr:hypothetical protein CBS101457_001644 [Exobasidium rhododendri]
MPGRTSSLIQEVHQRHAGVLSAYLSSEDTAECSYTATYPTIRSYDRWKELIDEKGGDDDDNGSPEEHREKGAGAEEPTPSPSLFGPAYVPAELTVRNDYSQHFVDTGAGQSPGNAVGNPGKLSRFVEYPKLKRLVEAKSEILSSTSHPPVYLQADLTASLTFPTSSTSFHLARLLPIKYDVVIVDPPLESYEWESVPGNRESDSRIWSWDQIASLPMPQIMAKESFIFLWIGSGANDGLERGREVLTRWGYRRCEDIVWVQTNLSVNEGDVNDTFMEKGKRGHSIQASSSSCFAKSAQHCLMGIRGTVRRSNDTRFVHCNIDTDVILWPGEKRQDDSNTIDTRSKPPEMMDLIENFCLGTRRLELFGTNRNLRRGWLTIGSEVGPQAKGWPEAEKGENSCAAHARQHTPVAYDKLTYDAYFGVDRAGCALAERVNLIPFNEEVESLRPRSPSSGADRGISQASTSTNLLPHRQYQNHQQQQQQHNLQASDPAVNYSSSFSQSNAAKQTNGGGGGGGFSGLGAGGMSVVSVPSGSEMLSGAQANVLLSQPVLNQARTNQPNGLSRQRKM